MNWSGSVISTRAESPVYHEIDTKYLVTYIGTITEPEQHKEITLIVKVAVTIPCLAGTE